MQDNYLIVQNKGNEMTRIRVTNTKNKFGLTVGFGVGVTHQKKYFRLAFYLVNYIFSFEWSAR